MARLVFSADSHLNKTYSKMSLDRQTERRAQLRRAWAATVDFAIKEGADLYLHGGDLFDQASPRMTELTWVARHLQRLREVSIPAYLIGGNHDIPKSAGEGATPQKIYHEVRVAHVFTDPLRVQWEMHDFGGFRLAVGGLPPDPRLGPGDDPFDGVADLEPPIEADAAVLMLHYALEGCLFVENEPIISRERIADLRRVDLVLVGHLHERKTLHIGDVTVAFSGPTERMSFGELNVETGFIEARLDHSGVKVKHHTLPTQPMKRRAIRTGDIPLDNPHEALKDHIRAESDPDQLFQLRLEGPLNLKVYQQLRASELRIFGADLNFFFDLDTSKLTLEHEVLIPVGAGAERVTPLAEIDAVAEAWLQETTDPGERELLRAASNLIHNRYQGER